MIKPFEFYFDFASPYTFIAHKEIRKVEKENSLKSAFIIGKVDSNVTNKGLVLGESVSFARDLGNHPANIMTPTLLAKKGKEIADVSAKMGCHIFNLKEIKKICNLSAHICK